MGDRCWVEVTVRKDNAERFLEIVRYDPESTLEGELAVEMTFQEVNYGMGQELDRAASEGLEFYGQHTAGDSYGCSEFYTDGARCVAYIPTGDDGYGVVVSGGTPSERMERLRELEQRITARKDLIERLHNPLYDLTRQSDVHPS
jgi:hypothetical protein